MLATNIRKFKEEAIHEGLEQGLERGSQLGLLEGERRVLQSLLSMKFGDRWRHLGESVNQVNSAERLEAIIKVVATHTCETKDSSLWGRTPGGVSQHHSAGCSESSAVGRALGVTSPVWAR